eukprot:Colp12_sorted_trinity150504_noHs@8381
MADTKSIQTFELSAESELRIEFPSDSKSKLTLVKGRAEIFGTELARGRQYGFPGKKLAVYTWEGCTLELDGSVEVAYTSKETPMWSYLNAHEGLEHLRDAATKLPSKKGPRVLLAGSTDVGKSTLCRIILNYAVRRGRRPTYVDLDIGQGGITVPGMISALPLERPYDVEEGLSLTAPLVYHYGHSNLAENPVLYKHVCEKMADTLNKRLAKDEVANSSGIVINTCGWIDGLGYELLVHAAKVFEVDVVFVIDQERLHNDLRRELSSATVVKLPKSGGVVTRSKEYRRSARNTRIREYFYGTLGDLCPHSMDVKFKDIEVYEIGAPPIPASCLPLGQEPPKTETQPVRVTIDERLTHNLLSVSYGTSGEPLTADVVDCNVAGFVYVSHVDVAKEKLTILSPSPGALPSRILLSGTIKWMEQ